MELLLLGYMAPYLQIPIKRSYDNSRTLSGSDFKNAWAIVKESKCKEVYVYAMGLEPWLNYVMALKYTPDSIQLIESDLLV